LIYVSPRPEEKKIKLLYNYDNYFKKYSGNDDYLANAKEKEKDTDKY
jgi:hypothetical protein